MGIAGAYGATVYGWLAGDSRLSYPDFGATFILPCAAGAGRGGHRRGNRGRLLRQQPVPPRIRLAGGGGVAREALEAGQVSGRRAGGGRPGGLHGRARSGVLLPCIDKRRGRAAGILGAGQRVPSGAVNLGRTDAVLRASQPWGRSLLAQLGRRPRSGGATATSCWSSCHGRRQRGRLRSERRR